MSIELHPQGLARYEHLFKHPIYYYSAFQYMRGSLYRAVLGYETIWDKEYENSLIRQLDHVLHYHMEKQDYYLEDVKFIINADVFGCPWKRGVARKFSFTEQHRKFINAGQRAVCRINLLDNRTTWTWILMTVKSGQFPTWSISTFAIRDI
jgi:hypothetical protein